MPEKNENYGPKKDINTLLKNGGVRIHAGWHNVNGRASRVSLDLFPDGTWAKHAVVKIRGAKEKEITSLKGQILDSKSKIYRNYVLKALKNMRQLAFKSANAREIKKYFDAKEKYAEIRASIKSKQNSQSKNPQNINKQKERAFNERAMLMRAQLAKTHREKNTPEKQQLEERKKLEEKLDKIKEMERLESKNNSQSKENFLGKTPERTI
jgi:hypothetical protein